MREKDYSENVIQVTRTRGYIVGKVRYATSWMIGKNEEQWRQYIEMRKLVCIVGQPQQNSTVSVWEKERERERERKDCKPPDETRSPEHRPLFHLQYIRSLIFHFFFFISKRELKAIRQESCVAFYGHIFSSVFFLFKRTFLVIGILFLKFEISVTFTFCCN